MALLKEVVQNFLNTTLVLLESVKTQASHILEFSFRRRKNTVFLKPFSKSTVMKHFKGVNMYHVKCDVTNQAEVTELFCSLVREDSATLNLIAETILVTSIVFIIETDSRVFLLTINLLCRGKARQKHLYFAKKTVFQEPLVDKRLCTLTPGGDVIVNSPRYL